MLYVGLDLHTKHIAVCVLSQTGQVAQRARVRGLDEMLRLLQGLPDRFEVCYEASCSYGYYLSVSDLHVYLTVPFVLSWSLMDALARGATVLASDTSPVRDVIEHNHNGLLTNFFDVEAMAGAAEQVLDAPQDFKHLGRNGVALIHDRYRLEVCLPQMRQLYADAVSARAKGTARS
jgi:glycosyltransferase involved in cell wall biosynthesis